MEREPTTPRTGLDAEGWATALGAHSRWLRTVVLARTGEAAAVDDVMQEVALAALRQPPGKLETVQAGPWLYRLAVTQSLLYRRKMGRQRRLLRRWVDRQEAELATEGGEPGAWLLAREMQHSVQAVVNLLNTRDREVLLLKYSEDWSYRQLSDHLGIGVSAVEARLHRARQRLRVLLTRMAVIEVES